MSKKCNTKDKKITTKRIQIYYDTLTQEEKDKYERKIDNAGFTNNIVFPIIMTDEEICKKILSMLIGKKVTKVKFVEKEKDYKLLPGKRGIRLDVYLENDDAIHNIEMQVDNHHDAQKRVRFYQSIIDAQRAREGVLFKNLKDMYIIFICMFDPFELGLPVYTTKTVFNEEETFEYIDGVYRFFYNADMYDKVKDKELSNFLEYCKTGKPLDEFTNDIHDKVVELKDSEEWRKSIMTWQIHESILINESMMEGKTKGMIEGKIEGKIEGENETKAKIVKKFLDKGDCIKDIAEFLELSEDEVTKIKEEYEKTK